MEKPTSITQLKEQIEQADYGVAKIDSQSRLIVYTTNSNRVGVLKEIADLFGGQYSSQKSGPGWRSSQGSAQINQFTVLVKPAAKSGQAVSVSSLDARVFTKGGTTGTFMYAGQNVSVVSFTSALQIEQSIINGAKTNGILGNDIAEQFEDFFQSKRFTWDPNMPVPLLKKLGVYAGEVLVGWALFQTNKQDYMDTVPFTGTVRRFHVPNDPSFSGVDSFVEMMDGTFYGVSSKFGVGAKASFFTNLLDKGIKNRMNLRPSVFKSICDTCAENGFEYKRSRDIVYTYGIKKILGLNIPITVYNEIVQNNYKSPNVVKLVNAIKAKKPSDEIVRKLPVSVSAFFNRKIAEMLNNDQASMDQVVEILQGKDYWQANLQTDDWLNGKLRFKYVKAAKARVKFIGSKSAIDDITCKQGWINYELSDK